MATPGYGNFDGVASAGFHYRRCDIGTPLWSVWMGMTHRCSDPKSDSWRYYGGRGITICRAWHDFVTFRDWALAHGWQPGLQIDRIDTNGNYEPSNCHFVTPTVNARNRRGNFLVTAWGETHCLAEWLDDPRVTANYFTAWYRLRHGVEPERAFDARRLP